MPRKPPRATVDTLALLQKVSFELFGRHGYDGVSIGDIAAAAGLSKGALYWYFPGKNALYLDCLKRLHRLFDEHIFSVMRREPDPILGILAIFRGTRSLALDPRVDKGVAGYWLVPSNSVSAEVLNTQRGFEENALATIERTLRRAVENNRLDLKGELKAMSHAIMFLIEAALLPLRRVSPDELNELLGVLARTLFRAYAADSSLPVL